MNNKTSFIFILCVFLTVFSGCDTGTNNQQPDPQSQQPNPQPVVSSISPDSFLSRLSTFTLTVTGSNFMNGSTIVFDGMDKITRFISTSKLECDIDAEDTQLANSRNPHHILHQNTGGDPTVPVIVRNPEPGGGDSDVLEFTIVTNYTFNVPELFQPNNDNDPVYPVLASDDEGILFTAYEEGEYYNGHIMFHSSRNGGESWTNGKKLTNNEDGFFCMNLTAKKDGDLYLLWNLDYETSAGLKLEKTQFKRSWDGGKTWTSTRDAQIMIRHLSLTGMFVNNEGYIYVVILDHMNDKAIYFLRSANHGDSWTQPQKVYVHRKRKRYQSGYISADNQGNVYLVIRQIHSDAGLYFMRSNDRGDSWTAPVLISESDEYIGPDITCDQEGNVYIVTSRRGRPLIFVSNNYGKDWSGEIRVSGKVDKISRIKIALDQMGNVNVAWCFELDTGFYYARSTARGQNWSETLNIYKNPVTCNNPVSYVREILMSPEGDMYVLWTQRDRVGLKPVSPYRPYFTCSR